jgi:hypothetical protein
MLQQIEAATLDTDKLEKDAVQAIRELYAPYPRHNGFIQTGHFYQSDEANYRIERDAYMMIERGQRTTKLRGARCRNLGDVIPIRVTLVRVSSGTGNRG